MNIMIVIIVIIILLNAASTECLEGTFLEMGSYSKFAQSVTEALETDTLLISDRCSAHLSKYASDLLVEETWALEMFDSNSKLPPGLLKGRLTDLGSFDECLGVSGVFNVSTKIFGKYCIATIPLNLQDDRKDVDLVKTIKSIRVVTPNGKTGIQLATCMPDVCSAKEIGLIFSAIGLEMDFHEELCQTTRTQFELNTTAFIAIIFFSLILAIMVLSTAYDVVLYYSHQKPSHQLLVAFSILTNVRSLLALSKSSNQIGCLHGIRVISAMWIIIRHRYSIQPSLPTNNYFYKGKWQNTEANMYMINAVIAVDTFLLLGGTLVAYNYLASVKKGHRFNIILHYVHRYVRLTPVIIALIVFYVALLRQVGSGPLWPHYVENKLVIGCETYWWKTILYIQNYGYQSTMCIPHSWYLCVDMQLFVLSPILLMPMTRWPKITIGLTALLAVCSVIFAFTISWINELNFITNESRSSEKIAQYFYLYYFSTPVRAAPWLIGIILGYVVFNLKENENKIVYNKIVIAALWILSLVAISACIFAGHNLIAVEYEKTGTSLYMALNKPIWAIGVSWIIYACVCGYAGPVNWFLSLPFFEVLSKLTYTLYLVHYAVIYIMVLQVRETTTFGDLQAMHAFWGDFVFTLAASVILMLSFELPVITIEKVLLKRWEKH